MSTITYDNQKFDCKEQENLLDAFFRNKIDVPFSCRNGTCQACLIQAKSGDISTDSQVGLSTHLKNTNHLLPCRCYPTTDMELQPPSIEDIFAISTIVKLEPKSKKIMAVTIKPNKGISKYRTGQFINIRTHLDNKVRSYSLTSSYENNQNNLCIHVQRIEAGHFSNWIFEQARTGDEIKVHHPLGACFNSQNFDVAGKLFISTSSGLGSEFAIIKENLENGFIKPVHLYHSSKDDSGLYLIDEIHYLEKQYENFSYTAYVSKQKSNLKGIKFGDVDQMAFENFENLNNWEVYLYGNPVMVKSATRNAQAKGCEEHNIFSDSFEYGENIQYNNSTEKTDKMEFIEEEKRQFEPNPTMWKILGEGVKLNQILNDFYDKVLVDPLLAPFFKGVTKDHIVGKQYAFLNQIYTGKDCYFGDRPRNAHQWMIISDSLFDHREKLFADSCIKCGLEEPYLSEILAFDESYRDAIVKTKVWPRITDGEIKPIKGFEEMILDIGSICDGCEKELEPGDKVHYHDRTGEMFCEECRK